jgi:hypothetical protein
MPVITLERVQVVTDRSATVAATQTRETACIRHVDSRQLDLQVPPGATTRKY